LSARIAAVLDIQQLRGRIGIRRAAMIGVVAVVLLLAISPLRAVGRSGYELRRLAAHSFVPVGNGVTALQPSTQAPTGLVPLEMDVLSRPTLKVRTQAADAIPSAFEGVSVKPNPSGRSGVHKGPTLSGNELIAIDVQVRWLIVEAYRLSSYQLLGGPGWISTDYFDVTAKVPASASVEQWRLMLRTLLADRFHLIVHTETKDEPIYALVLTDLNGALGPNLHRATTDCAALRAAAGPDLARTTIPCSFNLQLGRRAGRGLDMATLAGWLSPDAGRMVVDKTGLEGVFDFDLTYTPDPLRHHLPGRFPTVDPEGPSILAAVQEQLGLKLEAQQNLGDVLVIDHVEQPTPD
jgi:uncharacterized protein (TIGR03435 family)